MSEPVAPSQEPTAPAEPVVPPVVVEPPATPPVEPEPSVAPTPAEPPVEPPPVVEPEPVDLKADEYKIPDGLPVKEISEYAVKNKLTQEQLDDSVNTFSELYKSSITAQANALKKAGEDHIKTWGDEAKTKLALAKRALKHLDPEGKLTKILNDPTTQLGSHPVVLDFFYSRGEELQEGGFLKSVVNLPTGEKTAAQAIFPNHPTKES